MGEFKFRLPEDWSLETRQAKSIHVIGLDGIPWPCRVSVDGQILSILRNRDESGKVFIACPFAKHGEFTISTGTLAERIEPFRILVELARGTLHRLRNQISFWGEGGLEIPDSIHQNVATSINWLSKAIMHEDETLSDQDARKSLELAFDGIFELSQIFGEEIAKVRTERAGMPDFWTAHVAAEVDGDQSVSTTQTHLPFDLVQFNKPTEQTSCGKNIIAGPLVDASAGGLKRSIIELDDFYARRDHLLNRCRETINSLPSSVSLIHVACGLNGMGHRHLSYPQQIEVTTEMLSLIDKSEVDIPTMVSFDFPWAERLASAVGGIHPIQIADSLLRQGEPISFIGLDINLDYWPGGSVIRDPFQWVSMIDVWSQLGLPLVVCFRMPSGTYQQPVQTSDRLINEVRSNLDDAQRLKLLNTVLPMLVARPAVHGFIWRQLEDDDDFRFPGSGLLENSGKAKPVINAFAELADRLRRKA